MGRPPKLFMRHQLSREANRRSVFCMNLWNHSSFTALRHQMVNPFHFWRNASRRAFVHRIGVLTIVLLLNWVAVDAVGGVGQGAVALLTPDVAGKLQLTDGQKQKIEAIARA